MKDAASTTRIPARRSYTCPTHPRSAPVPLPERTARRQSIATRGVSDITWRMNRAVCMAPPEVGDIVVARFATTSAPVGKVIVSMRKTNKAGAGARRIRPLLAALPLLVSGCAGLDRSDQGRLQPQAVSGPCQVDKFYILPITAVHTRMTIGNAGQACAFTIFNPDLQVVLTNALVSDPPAHGRATAELVTLGRQGQVSYTPQPGYTGTDRFTITLEPQDLAVAVAVTVQPAAPAS